MLSRAAFVDAAIVTVAASAPPPYASRSGGRHANSSGDYVSYPHQGGL